MNAANESSPAPSLRRLPFSVRLAPHFVNSLFAVLPEDEDDLSEEIQGLLFGMVETGFSVLRMFHLSSPIPGIGRQANFEELLTRSKKNPQLAEFTLLGWFSVRKVDGLQPDDIAFHERNFGELNDIALIIKNEPTGSVSLGLYCRSLDGVFSSEAHRWGTVRTSSVSAIVAPIEVPMRAKIHDDFYMRAYQFNELGEDDEPVPGWKDALASKTKKTFDLLKTVKSEDTGESADAKSESEKTADDDLHSFTSLSQALHFATRGGAAPAPARIKEEPAEPRQPLSEPRQPTSEPRLPISEPRQPISEPRQPISEPR
jgi:hypothetical protein